MLSVFDIFKIGVGPSSSHTVGPMKAMARVGARLTADNLLERVQRVTVNLYGSLALTGHGHWTDKAVLLGLAGCEPETIEPERADAILVGIEEKKSIALFGSHVISFSAEESVRFCFDKAPSVHPNELQVLCYDTHDAVLFEETYYSIGGGFVVDAQEISASRSDKETSTEYPIPNLFQSAHELLTICATLKKSIADVILDNEDAIRPRAETRKRLENIWRVMSTSIDRGLNTNGSLPGKLGVKRRASSLFDRLSHATHSNEREEIFDWLNVYAMAVNEENACGGKVVTAPTNGAAGIIPAVIKFYCDDDLSDQNKDNIITFLLTAAGIGMLYKTSASISGAEMGCQGEVGVACSMAAAGLAAIWGGTPEQVEHAAEIGMEHNLGLTCDPVGGLVQIPCIERNAIGAVKAVNAARLALRAADEHKVSLDQVIETMRQTGLDMSSKYKETSEGGLAVNVIEC